MDAVLLSSHFLSGRFVDLSIMPFIVLSFLVFI